MEKWTDALLNYLKQFVPVRIGWSEAEFEAPVVIVSLVSAVPIKMNTFLAAKPSDEQKAIVARAKRIYSVLYQFDVFGKATRERDTLTQKIVDALYTVPEPGEDFPLIFRKINRIAGGESLFDFERMLIEARFFAFEFKIEEVYYVHSTELLLGGEMK